MTWFLLALIAPFLYAITNHIDKGLLSKYFKEGGVGTLILFSALLSVLALPVILIFDPSVLTVDPYRIAILATVGLLDIAILWFYLLALKGDEPSIIIVFYQLVPVFALGLGYLILGETLTQTQLVAMAIVILGTTLISFELDEDNKFSLRLATICFMTLAALAWALESVLFKYVALEEDVWRSLFWEHLMLVLIGVFLFTSVRTYRYHFLNALRQNSAAILGLNVTNESLYMIGNITVAFAVMLAPVSLILLGQSFQTFFVFLIGILLTLVLPHIYQEKLTRFSVAQKLLAILITGYGTWLLLATT
ncbi:EamA family transporter [Patescibacteria group bacterium]|jgi:drug/metabolite transporter (DMT)-like permease|nr:EamA family transporter [Patescibacteria group bacterium]